MLQGLRNSALVSGISVASGFPGLIFPGAGIRTHPFNELPFNVFVIQSFSYEVLTLSLSLSFSLSPKPAFECIFSMSFQFTSLSSRSLKS